MASTPERAPRYRRLKPDDRREMLIAAGLACLKDGGLLAFTIDRITAEAEVSRGLITHHFGSKDGLLVAVYRQMYDRLLDTVLAAESATDLAALIDAVLSEDLFAPGALRAWLALWSEIGSNPALMAVHREHYTRYRTSVASVIATVARARGRKIDAEALAVTLIALVDGLWLERSLDPEGLSGPAARAACTEFLAARLGPVD
ncbi:MAG: TetR family transcriptional regulator [Limimaricola sp.]|uniref:TetR family transcriptional regulator C-terminal domain-containing protein n=1 Tax=Limimaricola sp. TaxID=2211665 RepID=UPI001D429456|nr:TetR family transcriptional regulator C-terminal domain-containing protein [Limimaricola sp.]MBI1417865.1 TetR family transcriptional regulator [Limimaricola sp.]